MLCVNMFSGLEQKYLCYFIAISVKFCKSQLSCLHLIKKESETNQKYNKVWHELVIDFEYS